MTKSKLKTRLLKDLPIKITPITDEDYVVNTNNGTTKLKVKDITKNVENKVEILEDNISEFSEQLDKKANEIDLAVEKNRIDNLIALPEGSTKGDAELIDARVGADGVTYSSVGTAMRLQASKLSRDIAALNKCITKECFNEVKFDAVELNKVYAVNFPNGTTLANYNSYKKIVSQGEKYYISTTTVANKNYAIALMYDSDNNLVKIVGQNTEDSSVTLTDYEVNIPGNVATLIVTSRSDYTTKIKKTSYLYPTKSMIEFEGSIKKIDEFIGSMSDNKVETIEFDGVESNTLYPIPTTTPTTLNFFKSYYINVKAGERYRITTTVPANKWYGVAQFYNENGYVGVEYQNIEAVELKVVNYEFVVPNGATLMRCCVNSLINVVLNKVVEETINVKKELKEIRETTLDSKIFAYKLEKNNISVSSKYGKDKDFVTTLRPTGGNNLFDFYRLGTIKNDSKIASKNFGNTEVLVTSVTDWHCPYIVRAVNNIDGDNCNESGIYNYFFTGGNHQYNNSGSGSTPTAKMTSLRFFVDGREISKGEGYANSVEIRWTNLVQAYNTTKIDGSGREILQENHILTYDGKVWDAHVELIPLEDIVMEKWYGFQAVNKGIYDVTSRYVGGSNRGAYDGTTASDCGNGKANKMILCGNEHGLSIEIDTTYDMGATDNYATPYAFTTSYGKAYFNISQTMTMLEGDRRYLRGKYKFFRL